MTRLAPVEFDPDAECPRWISFLGDIMDGNENLVSFLQRAIGYSLTGDIGERCLFILYGTGANGKTVFLETIAGVLGDYAATTTPETLMARRDDGGPT